MLEDYLKEIERIEHTSRSDKSAIDKMQNLRHSAQLKLDKLESDYQELSQVKENPDIYQALDITIEEANNILLNKMYEATTRNTEFSVSPFLERLVEVCLNPESILITPVGNRSISVQILLNETAGSLSDYASAISSVRGTLGGGRKAIPSRSLASHFWREKFYGPAREGKKVTRRHYNRETKEYEKRDVTEEQIEKYWNTINMRLDASGKVAPFWEILDQGTTPLASDDGGTAYPKNSRTNFVAKAITAIRQFFERQLSSTKQEVGGSLKELRTQIDDIKSALKEIDREIDRLTNESIEFIDLVAKKLGDELENIDKSKIPSTEYVAKAYRERQQTRFRIGGGRRVSATAYARYQAALLGNR